MLSRPYDVMDGGLLVTFLLRMTKNSAALCYCCVSILVFFWHPGSSFARHDEYVPVMSRSRFLLIRALFFF